MLSMNKKDTEVVSAWLDKALADGAKRGLSKTGLATTCGVTPQAVDGWLRTGRIRKGNLEQAVAYFGHGPSFTGAPLNARQDRPEPVVWPFRLVSSAEIHALPKRRRDRLDKLVRARLDEWLEDDTAAKRKAA
jgi:hypothetical protein